MNETPSDVLRVDYQPVLENGLLVLAFGGWMDGGDVSTGTVQRLVDLLHAEPVAEIDADPFYIFNFPGSMEIAALFRPHVDIDDGVVQSIEMPKNVFFAHEPANLALFLGKEPNLRWRTFGEAVFRFAQASGVNRILFVGSFGGTVPHTREPRLYASSSDPAQLAEIEQFGVRRTGYEGPGSFISYLMTHASQAGIKMTSLIAEIPSYLQGANPSSIEAVTRRLAKILQLPLDLDSLRAASTAWEMKISTAVEEDDDLAEKVRQLEQDYDNELLDRESVS